MDLEAVYVSHREIAEVLILPTRKFYQAEKHQNKIPKVCQWIKW